jgi:hypothetical protein
VTPIHLRFFWACAVAACVAIVFGGAFFFWATLTDSSERNVRLIGSTVLALVAVAFASVVWGMP